MASITITDYSEKSILLTGPGTKEHKELLKKHNCKWNRGLCGWICSLKNEGSLLEELKNNEIDYEKTNNELEIKPCYVIKGKLDQKQLEELKKLGAKKEFGWTTDIPMDDLRKILDLN